MSQSISGTGKLTETRKYIDKNTFSKGQYRIKGLTNATLYTDRTYYVRVRYLSIGTGYTNSNGQSGVGFIAYWNSWASTRNYFESPTNGVIQDWTYSFTVSEDVTPTGTALYYIVNNGWANGSDGNTVELYYVKYWDSEGNVYNEEGDETVSANDIFSTDDIIEY